MRKTDNSLMRVLYRVNGVSIENSSPEAQVLPNALKLYTKVKL